MDFLNNNLLTVLILLPVVGAVLLLVHRALGQDRSQLKWVTLLFTLVNFVISLALFSSSAVKGPSGFFFEQNVPWIRAINDGNGQRTPGPVPAKGETGSQSIQRPANHNDIKALAHDGPKNAHNSKPVKTIIFCDIKLGRFDILPK